MAFGSSTARVVGLIDMDCFYVQVHLREQPELVGKPVAVVQYRDYRKGGIIAVSYEARARGVKRGGTFGADAEKVCPDINLVRVPESRGKADLTKYRNASSEVFAALKTFEGVVIERASVDEAYVDMTNLVDSMLSSKFNQQLLISPENLPSTFVIPETKEGSIDVMQWYGDANKRNAHFEACRNELRLLLGATIVSKMRAKVLEATGFHCSAGISHNKTLAKLACGVNKPRKQTIFPLSSVKQHFKTQNISKVRGLGGKLGEQVKTALGVEMMSDLSEHSIESLIAKFGDKTGTWLHFLSKGIEFETVIDRDLSKSIGCGKNFNGPEALNTVEKVKFWLGRFSEEMFERLTEDAKLNDRNAKCLTVSLHNRDGSFSRALEIVVYDAGRFADDAYRALVSFNTTKDADPVYWDPPLNNLSLNASRFLEIGCLPRSKPITEFFNPTSLENYQLQMKESVASGLDTDSSSVPYFPIENQNRRLEQFFNPSTATLSNSGISGELSSKQIAKQTSNQLRDSAVCADRNDSELCLTKVVGTCEDLTEDGDERLLQPISCAVASDRPNKDVAVEMDASEITDEDSCDFIGLLNELCASPGNHIVDSPFNNDVVSCLDDVICGVLSMNVNDDSAGGLNSDQSRDECDASSLVSNMKPENEPVNFSYPDTCDDCNEASIDSISLGVKRGFDMDVALQTSPITAKRLKMSDQPNSLTRLSLHEASNHFNKSASNGPTTSSDGNGFTPSGDAHLHSDQSLQSLVCESLDTVDSRGSFLDYIPRSLDSVDTTVWNALPAELSFELKQFYRSQKTSSAASVPAPSDAAAAKKPSKTTKRRRSASTTKRQSSTSPSVGNLPISVYFNKVTL